LRSVFFCQAFVTPYEPRLIQGVCGLSFILLYRQAEVRSIPEAEDLFVNFLGDALAGDAEPKVVLVEGFVPF
jgi:hypothetical protein